MTAVTATSAAKLLRARRISASSRDRPGPRDRPWSRTASRRSQWTCPRAPTNPSVIKLKAGVPAEITFGQSSGCTGYVQSEDLGFQADLRGGPQTVRLQGLQPGTYGFACGMNMVTGQIVVE